MNDTTAQAWLGKSMQHGQALKASGPCFTVFDGMSVVACGGVIPIWNGRAMAWSLISVGVERHAFGIHRFTKRFLHKYECRRIECTVDPRSEKAKAWAKRLGFTYEGLHKMYTPDGDDMELWVMLKPWLL